jgi:cell division protein ZapA (FtsZ GTPase activity inhibitor)
MEKNNLYIQMLGTSFSIAAEEDAGYLESLLKRYQAVVEDTRKATGLTDALQTAILTGFLLCDEIEKLKAKFEEQDVRKAEQLTLDLIARIDEVLPETPNSIDGETPPDEPCVDSLNEDKTDL